MKTSTDITSNNVMMQNTMSTATQDIILPDADVQKRVINAIEKMGNWYVNHIATYKGEYLYKNREASSKAIEYYEYLHNQNNIQNVVIGIDGNKPKDYINKVLLDKTLSNNRWMYRASDLRDDHINNPDDILLTKTYISKGEYAHERRFVADDCSGFMMAVYEYLTKSEFKQKDLQKYLGTERAILKYWSITTEYIFGNNGIDDDFAEWMLNEARIKRYKVSELPINFELLPGDLLASDGHVEFMVDDNHTFGWGQIYKEYLREAHFENNGDGSYKLVNSAGNYIDDSRYIYIFRYLGGMDAK